MNASAAEDGVSRSSLPTGRWVLALALLVVEYFLAVLLFDSERLPPVARETGVFALLGESMPLIVVVMTAALLVGGVPSDSERKDIAAAFREPRRTWPLFAAHLVGYAFALGVTVFVFNRNLDLSYPWLWVGAWALSGGSAFLFLIAAVVPKAAFRVVRRPIGRALVTGLLVGLIALLAGYATSWLWEPMSRMTLDVVVTLLELTGHEVISIPDELVVGTPQYDVFIDRPCSGYEGIGLIVVLLSFYLFYFRNQLRFPNALLLLPMGVALIWMANSLRIALLIVVGTWLSPEIAEGGFHSAAGWLLFCIITLGLVAISRQSGWFANDPLLAKGSFLTPEGAYLLPLLVLLATALVSNLFTANFDALYPLRVLTPLIPLWLFRRYYRNLTWSWSWTAVGLGVAVFVLWVALEPPPDPQQADTIPNGLAEMHWVAAAFWLTARVLGSTVLVPVVEELAFRGYLLRRLINSDFTAVSPRKFTASSFIISSVVFGMLHGRWVAGILAGMVYALAQYRRGQLTDAMIAHAVTNGLLAAYVVIFGHWGFW